MMWTPANVSERRRTALPERGVTVHSGDMGYTIGRFAGERKMPWKECNQMDERLKFIARLLNGEKMAAVCRDFNVSRKTGYKILKRYNDVGLEGLTDRSRR